MDFLKSLFPQKIINLFYHLPKAILANILYGFPTKELKVIGITGTDGKTTTVNMVYKILKDAGKNVSMISTINAVIGGKVYDTGFHVTSPDSFTVQKLAKQAVDSGDEYLVLETTSHGLDQYRFWGIKFEVGVITNITHEHLDYHKNLQNYTKTKMKLLEFAKNRVININLVKKYDIRIDNLTTFGLSEGDFNEQKYHMNLNIPGKYNIENALAALAVVNFLGISGKDGVKALESLVDLSGRMEEVKNEFGIKIIVDFAHTPNGLKQALKTLRDMNQGRLIAIFGAASKRDVSKRPLMGEVAGKYADFVVLTAEDPRGENIENICLQIAKGVEKSGKKENKNYWIIPDRKKALQFVLKGLVRKGDVMGIFGKGHERSMNLDGKKEIAWSDVEEVNGILKQLVSSQGKINSPTRLPSIDGTSSK